MPSADQILERVRSTWAGVQPLELPPQRDIVLWQEGRRTIFLDQSYGPAVPYPPVRRSDSESNFGYVDTKSNPDLIAALPEVQGWPEFAILLTRINTADSPVESVGCAVGLFPLEEQGDAKFRVGCYVDVVQCEPVRAAKIEPAVALAARIMATLEGCEQWWCSCEVGVQRLRHLHGSGAYGLMMRINAAGRSEQEAKEMFAISLQRVANAFLAD